MMSRRAGGGGGRFGLLKPVKGALGTHIAMRRLAAAQLDRIHFSPSNSVR